MQQVEDDFNNAVNPYITEVNKGNKLNVNDFSVAD